ncbi:hypothetical protein VOLCADRAFT_90363 [Volvox carteri f. nagariensis]|uniref:Uncharacterized protein n=1 Tax=Volvox carteri f. nagariensis TaxID=3068 RepID=D8TU63_VOLCA|nr:uncharacterized protein VOLCADRAFT_90363 [Volvox carteri f. nagariensis]EFJ48983.1 hypothetical protein VOLCADRAFT_90363 [Volvox carteri f. nagariensis]|eukprot:XP_002949880.1 hypothetical protein VOLCADRAFT_90363 [Volvox carteri f. nagariensis]
MKTILRTPGCARPQKGLPHPYRPRVHLAVTFPNPAQHPATPRRSIPAYSFFDGLKNLLPGSGGNKTQPSRQQQEEPLDEEEDEGSEMMRLDSESGGLAEDQSAFGPLAVLLVGFMAEEVEQFRGLMLEMEADMVKQALETEFPQYEQPPLGTRRTVFLSGMIGAEVVEVIAAYREAGMPPTVWAAAVPNNYTRVVRELVEEVHADNAAMMRRAQEEQARQAALQELEGEEKQQR